MVNRRVFLFSTAALTAGCALRTEKRDAGAVMGARAPQVGQSWRYAKHDQLTGQLFDTEAHRVSAVGDSVEIEISSEARAAESDRVFWDPFSLLKHPRPAAPSRPLPSEIQRPWGKVAIDPHWSETLAFRQPVPLWPVLQPGWSTRVRTDYLTPDAKTPQTWQLNMHAHDWESVSTPAGSFRALRYTNLIDFTSQNVFRRSSQRHETIWFVPEIGRWAIRESSGTYYHEDSVDDQLLTETPYRWELEAWT